MQTPGEPRPATGYVLLTHGPKHTAVPLERRPGARRQLTMIRNYARQFGFRLERTAFDHVRAAEELADFETLSRLRMDGVIGMAGAQTAHETRPGPMSP